MSNNFLFKLKNAAVTNSQSSNNTSPFDSTLPQSSCKNGSPNDLHEGYGVNSWEVLYSIWNSYQKKAGAKFTHKQALNYAPVSSDCSGPENIFIMRHCEKSADKPNYNLDPNGIYRACHLVEYVNHLATTGYPISYIVTCNPCPYNSSDPSMRPVQTASIISFMLNIPIYIYGGSQDYDSIVSALFPNTTTTTTPGAFDGLNVLIIWEHSSIQQLCLNILDRAGDLSRLPGDLKTGDEFFKKTNPCPDGNYLATKANTKQNGGDAYIPPVSGTVKGVGDNTQYYPYWNNDNFDSIYWLKGNIAPPYKFSFSIFKQPIETCYPSCGLHIGLYQPLSTSCSSSYIYYNTNDEVENSCQVPTDWTWTPEAP
jgi:hypothetical protein